MRGDANDFDDQDPYTATTVQRTFFSIPGIAPAIQQLGPLVLGGLTLGASALSVIWALATAMEPPSRLPKAPDTAQETPTTLIEIGPEVSVHRSISRVGPWHRCSSNTMRQTMPGSRRAKVVSNVGNISRRRLVALIAAGVLLLVIMASGLARSPSLMPAGLTHEP